MVKAKCLFRLFKPPQWILNQSMNRDVTEEQTFIFNSKGLTKVLC